MDSVKSSPMNVERRHAAILSADAKGYSRLMADDEVGTVRTLIAYRTVMRDWITSFRGRVVDSPGDNLLAEFGNAIDAVECAVAIQQSLHEQNAGLHEHRRWSFAWASTSGTSWWKHRTSIGDAVNIAARLEALADAGGICVSEGVHDLVAPQAVGGVGISRPQDGEEHRPSRARLSGASDRGGRAHWRATRRCGRRTARRSPCCRSGNSG